MTDDISTMQRLDRVRKVVSDDFARVSQGEDPFTVLNLPDNATDEQVQERYHRYEQFYRDANFQRLGDPELSNKAGFIRRAISEAMSAITSQAASAPETPHDESDMLQVDADSAALGDIYFRDGLTYLKLRDLDSAVDCLQRATDYDHTRGDVVAYFAYARFKLRPNEPRVVEQSRQQLTRAAELDPDKLDIFLLRTRFAINIRDRELAEASLAEVKRLRPTHPKLARLEDRISRL